MTYKTTEEKYWNLQDLDTELERVYDICYGCQLCFNLCDSFPVLFDFVDEHGDEVSGMTQPEKEKVVDLCYQCKLCYPKCPYVPPHEWAIDFPRLMQRAKLAWKREKDQKHRFLIDPEEVGRLGSQFPALTNWANKNEISRAITEKIVGIHRERNLPQYHKQTFNQWFYERPTTVSTSTDQGKSNGKVALFFSCTVNYNYPDVGRAAIEVLERNHVEVIVPDQVCCGAPALHGGDYDLALKKVNQNLDLLHHVVEDGYEIVIPSPTCSMMLKEEYTLLVEDPRAAAIAENTYDLCQYLMNMHRAKKLDLDFKRGFGQIAYHFPCHLKNQNIGYQSRNLLRLLPETTVEMVDRCSGFDGIWGMQKETYKLSLKYGEKLFNGLEKAKPDLIVSDCPLSQLQIEKGVGRQAVHPILLVWEAYQA